MATMTSYTIVKELIESDGKYKGDPIQALAVWEYRTPEDDINWMVALVKEDIRAMMYSPYVNDAVLLWTAEAGLIRLPTEPLCSRCGDSRA